MKKIRDYDTALCTRRDVEEQHKEIPPPSAEDLQGLALAAPAMPGAESLTVDVLRALWGELDRKRLDRMMEQFQEAERLAAEDGLTFAEAMRMLAGADITKDEATDRQCSLLGFEAVDEPVQAFRVDVQV